MIYSLFLIYNSSQTYFSINISSLSRMEAKSNLIIGEKRWNKCQQGVLISQQWIDGRVPDLRTFKSDVCVHYVMIMKMIIFVFWNPALPTSFKQHNTFIPEVNLRMLALHGVRVTLANFSQSIYSTIILEYFIKNITKK